MFYEQFDNSNLYVDRDVTNMHKRRYHSLKNQPKKLAGTDEFDESEVELINDTFLNHLPEEVNDLTFIDSLSKEDAGLSKLISYFHEDDVGNILVARSQDKIYSSNRFEKLLREEVVMKLNIAALFEDLNPSQTSLFAKLIQQIRESDRKRRVPHDPMLLTKKP